MSMDEGLPWESEGDRPWEAAETPGWAPAEDDGWRGELHSDEWPENLAGPEYWLYKQQEDDE
jgi:hypothetical protein